MKPSFRATIKSRRCLIPADGFFEWKREGKKKLPIYLRRQDDQPFAFAGLWERWSKASKPIESCTILTTTLVNDWGQGYHWDLHLQFWHPQPLLFR